MADARGRKRQAFENEVDDADASGVGDVIVVFAGGVVLDHLRERLHDDAPDELGLREVCQQQRVRGRGRGHPAEDADGGKAVSRKPPREDDELDDVEHVVRFSGARVETEKEFVERVEDPTRPGRSCDVQDSRLELEAAVEDLEDE